MAHWAMRESSGLPPAHGRLGRQTQAHFRALPRCRGRDPAPQIPIPPGAASPKPDLEAAGIGPSRLPSCGPSAAPPVRRWARPHGQPEPYWPPPAGEAPHQPPSQPVPCTVRSSPSGPSPAARPLPGPEAAAGPPVPSPAAPPQKKDGLPSASSHTGSSAPAKWRAP